MTSHRIPPHQTAIMACSLPQLLAAYRDRIVLDVSRYCRAFRLYFLHNVRRKFAIDVLLLGISFILCCVTCSLSLNILTALVQCQSLQLEMSYLFFITFYNLFPVLFCILPCSDFLSFKMKLLFGDFNFNARDAWIGTSPWNALQFKRISLN